ncbi:alpha/beta-hydrolase [Neoconidiobolus thromboides FSU 785]|nr:alpha/beta-hydrolase [Neoconidiobolus thromboides FSU 785]
MKLNITLLSSIFYLSAFNGELQQEAKFNATSVSASSDPYLNNLISNLNQVVKDFKDIPVKQSRASTVTRLTVSNEATAKKFARLAGAAYCSDSTLSSWKCNHCSVYGGLKVVKVFDNSKHETRGFVGLDTVNRIVVISFRGTSNIKNWVQNVKIAKTDLFSGNSKIQVHLGFKQARDALSPVYTPVVSELLKSNPGFKLVVVGHSLGGAIGNLAAIDLQASQKLSWGNIQLFTYGQPRVGNADFANWFDSLNLLSTRVTNDQDIVPHVPPRSMSFNHYFVEMWLHKNSAKICSTSQIEDASCSLSAEPFLNVSDHLTYWDVRLGGSC